MSEAKIDEEIAENANKDAIDIKGNVVEDEPPTQNGQGQMDLGKTGTEDMPY
jgi:hypothetical protein